MHQQQVRKTKHAKAKQYGLTYPSINVANMFLQLVTRYFSRSNKLHRNFNQNTVKASYSSMNNVSKIIKGHDKKVTSKPRDQTPKCNCREKAECPMKGNCQVAHIII